MTKVKSVKVEGQKKTLANWPRNSEKRNSSFITLNQTTSMMNSSQKSKIEKVEEMVMVPVSKLDFEKINELAEGAMIARNLDKVNEIKSARKRLLEACNPNAFVKVKREKK